MKDSNDFGDNIQELLKVLRKLLKSQKSGNVDLSSLLGKKDVNLNLCFFTFLPVCEEEMAELEAELAAELAPELLEEGEDLKFELSKRDLEFLRTNGLKF